MSDYEDMFDDLEDDTEEQQLVFFAKDVQFAIPISTVREMLPLQEVIRIPNAPDWMRGVINVRNETFRLIDFRKRVDMQGLEDEEDELISQLEQREEEHKNWIDKLEEAVTEETAFEGELDPHKCKFGQWYDNFESNNTDVMFELKKFDRPHKAIHATADEAIKLRDEGKKEDAMELIENRRNGELARLVELFDSLRGYIRGGRKEVIILVETDTEKFAVVVDKVEVVESLRINEGKNLSSFQSSSEGFARHSQIARREKEEEIVYLVEPDWIVMGAEDIEESAAEKQVSQAEST